MRRKDGRESTASLYHTYQKTPFHASEYELERRGRALIVSFLGAVTGSRVGGCFHEIHRRVCTVTDDTALVQDSANRELRETRAFRTIGGYGPKAARKNKVRFVVLVVLVHSFSPILG